jgi:signal transduction histidine kinase
VVRHAHASLVRVTVRVADGYVQAEIRDDGVGPGPGARPGGRGLVNLAHRAQTLGGHMTVAAGPEGKGTVLTWRVPMTVAQPAS